MNSQNTLKHLHPVLWPILHAHIDKEEVSTLNVYVVFSKEAHKAYNIIQAHIFCSRPLHRISALFMRLSERMCETLTRLVLDSGIN